MKDLNLLFKEKNLKLTPQRYAIYKYLKSTKNHPSAESIYEELKEDYPTMSLATVYKTLKTLIELNLVQELNVGEDNFRFDANVDSHPHIFCLSCGRVDDVEGVNFTFLNKEIENYTDYSVDTHQLYFYGLCPKCKERGRK
ncbi:transcriptional regulator [Fervidicella metallireducens AeB]|uniref:Transcriptional regulator n=1 Tax=Fervidicella metallireducens AeB TaxID=1403537 RepID=A0A017RW57_9CLOT|nr:Fur family transcriptional regulator [Fervidicella metallireducens]EYE88145.1 transcriptional regulator [Fervidicella metallireducens AeB]